MASSSAFSLRVARCPSCGARLPTTTPKSISICEYCDARVEIVRPTRPRSPAPRPRPAAPATHQTEPQWSGAAKFLLSTFVTLVVAGAYLVLIARYTWSQSSDDQTAAAAEQATARATMATQQAAEARAQAMQAARRASASGHQANTKAAGATAQPRSRPSTPTPKKSTAPSGPVLSVAEARAQLEPKVLDCMRKAKTYSVRTYLGNKAVGPVQILDDSRTRIDGLRASLRGSLRSCIKAAGKTVRTRAFRSNYVRIELTNNAVPNPLASLPAKADHATTEATIAAADAKIRACARSHGEEGAREVFTFRIDGPTGAVMSAYGTYGSKAFRRCAEPIYRKLRFAKVREPMVKHTYRLTL